MIWIIICILIIILLSKIDNKKSIPVIKSKRDTIRNAIFDNRDSYYVDSNYNNLNEKMDELKIKPTDFISDVYDKLTKN